MNEATELANIVMRERGYVVLRWVPSDLETQPCPSRGTVLDGHLTKWEYGSEVEGQMVVQEETDIDDMLIQQTILRKYCVYTHVIEAWAEGAKYFRVIAE